MAVLAALAAATWLYGRAPTVPVRAAFRDSSQPLGYYLRGARILGTDSEGRIAYRILAEQLEELPGQDVLELDGVRVAYEPSGTTPWSISANRASAPKDASQLDLKGSVELRSLPADGGEQTIIATEALRFFPDTSNAESAEPVEIRVGDWHVDAVGLRTQLKGNTVELESNVHGKFAP